MPNVEHCITLFQERGDSEYGGEAVTQREHALQCALLAEQKDASSELISAALLHDIGHLLHAHPDDAPDSGLDDVHEELGDRFLTQIFSDAVTEPARLHVLAKRYMCTTVEGYHAKLSQPSMISLQLQGGLMSADEVAVFEQNLFYLDAIRLRQWDDAAKIPQQQTPPFEHFVKHLKAAAR